MLVATFLVACAAGGAPVDTATPTLQQNGLPTARDVFARTEAVYKKATSYSDRGYVEAAFVTGRRTRSERLTFTTAFVRGDRFRFESHGHGDSAPAFVIWNGGKRTRLKSFVDGGSVKDVESLDLAMAGTAGVTHEAARIVPSLLLPDILDEPSLSPSDAHVDGIEWVNNRRCYKISQTSQTSPTVDAIPQPAPSGVDWSGYVDEAAKKPVDARTQTVDATTPTVDRRSRVVWIDADSYAVRKIARHTHLELNGREFDVYSTIHYTPVLNGTVAAADLAEPTAATPSH